MDQMSETMALCCNQGTAYARNHTTDDCSSSVPPQVHETFKQMCSFAMDQCCKEFMKKKSDCQYGIEIATSVQSCASTKESVKTCCDQCISGVDAGKGSGINFCEVSEEGKNAEELLASDAFSQCCKSVATEDIGKSRFDMESVSSHTDKHSSLPSICEDYAPNELCAHHCIPIPGSYKCQCNDGFMLMADGRNCKEVTKNRCKPHNPCQYKCNDDGVEVKCSCRRGYELMSDGKSCKDIDECILDPPVCLPNTQCHNIQGSYKCIPLKDPKDNLEEGQCPSGFARNLWNNACDDINECKWPTPPCSFYLCENTIGGYKCDGISGDPANLGHQPKPNMEDRCPPGFKSGINEKCKDVDECVEGTHLCDQYQNCLNTNGSHECHCKLGFELDSTIGACVDIDECALGTHNCDRAGPQYQCLNIPGSFRCTKRVTTTVTPAPEVDYECYDSEEEIEESSNKTLNEINATTISASTAEIPIQSTPEIPVIISPSEQPKSITDSNNNADINPKIESTENIDNEIITNDVPEAEPSIDEPEPKGPIEPKYEPTEPNKVAKSKDEDELPSVVTNTPEVSTSPKLVVLTVGEETATARGQTIEDRAVLVDTKKIPKNEWTKINEKPTICQSGFEMDSYGDCFDIDECATNKHSCSGLKEICRNTMGGYLCDCSYGFRRDLSTEACILILTSSTTTSTTTSTTPSTTSTTHTASTKSSTSTSMSTSTSTTTTTSTTPAPTTSSTQTYTPVDPKNITPGSKGGKKIAEPEITQIEDRGSVYNCPWGTRLGDDKTCEDIDECATGEALCGPLQICTNLPGGYTCSCPSGHKLVGDHVCKDIDECAIGGSIPICSEKADCINTIGSYQCRCHKGFKSAPVNDKVCVDVDECTDTRPGELCQQRCNNVWGGYRCSCHRGYRINADNRTCSDVDECTEFRHKNLCIGRCVNEPGSFRCSCPPGYRLSEDRRNCIDIDECKTGEAPCPSGGQYEGSRDVCLNTRGGYRCQRITCPPGYKLESRHRCTKIQTYCPPADWACSHQPSTYSYNYITFVSNLYIPESKVDLFTIRGSGRPYAKLRFELRVVDVDAPPSVKQKADINAFLLFQTGNQAVMSLVRPLEGPQSIELELSMELYSRGQFGGIAVSKIYIYVSEYEF